MEKYAVIQTGNKQYRVIEGDVIDVELLEGDNKKVEFDVLLFSDGKKVKIGQPLVKGAKVSAEVLGDVRGPKVIAYKYKKRKSYHRKVGHRQDYARVKITKLTGGAKSVA